MHELECTLERDVSDTKVPLFLHFFVRGKAATRESKSRMYLWYKIELLWTI